VFTPGCVSFCTWNDSGFDSSLAHTKAPTQKWSQPATARPFLFFVTKSGGIFFLPKGRRRFSAGGHVTDGGATHADCYPGEAIARQKNNRGGHSVCRGRRQTLCLRGGGESL